MNQSSAQGTGQAKMLTYFQVLGLIPVALPRCSQTFLQNSGIQKEKSKPLVY